MRPSPPRSLEGPSADGTWSVAVPPTSRSSARLLGRFFSDGLLAVFAEPTVVERERTRLPIQNASKMPSNLSQSHLRA
jgi:hypothetical protein